MTVSNQDDDPTINLSLDEYLNTSENSEFCVCPFLSTKYSTCVDIGH